MRFVDTEDMTKFSVYYNRKAIRAAKRAKVDRILSDIVGVDYVRSVRLAFDPFSDYYLAPQPIIPINRTRKVRTCGASNRGHKQTETSVNTYIPLDASTPNAYDTLPVQVSTSKSTSGPTSWAQQDSIFGFISDTTRRTRPKLAENGELELFIPRLHSTSRSYSGKYWDVAVDDVNPGGYYRISRTERYRQMNTIGPSGRISQRDVDKILSAERLNSVEKFSQHATSLLIKARPNRRNFSLIREIGELKDLPNLLRGTLSGLIGLVKRGEFSWSDIFLSKEFGYDPLVSSITDLVHLPDIIAKRVNYLVSRIGKDTTFRSSVFGLEGLDNPPDFTYNVAYGEKNGASSASGFRHWSVRLVNSVNVRFPYLELPTLKRDVGLALYGAKFRPTDLYDLVPWTWLIDWFTGIGDYLDLISSVIDDESLVNWGLITYASRGTAMTAYSARQLGSYSYLHIDGGGYDYVTSTDVNHNSLIDYRYQRRTDIGSATEVKYTWLPDTLSGFQQAILGALFSQRTK